MPNYKVLILTLIGLVKAIKQGVISIFECDKYRIISDEEDEFSSGLEFNTSKKRLHISDALFYLDVNKEEFLDPILDEDHELFSVCSRHDWLLLHVQLVPLLEEAEDEGRVKWKENGGPNTMKELNDFFEELCFTKINMRRYNHKVIEEKAKDQSDLRVIY